MTEKPLRKGYILGLVCLAQFMVLLDISIVNVALPSMRNSLHFDAAGLQWVVNAYTLSFAGFLLLGGRAADLFGQRRLFLIGAALFGAASLVGGLANDRGLLIAARALQGFGGAILSPATLTILTTTFTESKERARAMGIWSAVAGAGGAAGALLGGVLTDLVNWRSIFFLNIPIAIIAIVAGMKLLTMRNERHSKSLDATGAVLVTLGLVSLVYGIVSSEQYGWSSWHSTGALVAGIVLLIAFAVNEAKFAEEPIMPLSLWKIPALATANATMFFIAMGMFAMWFFVSLDLQIVRGYSPLKAGLAFLPQTLAIIIGAQLSSRNLHRFGPRKLTFLATALGTLGMFWLSRALDADNVLLSVIVPGTLITFGLGLGMTPVISSAMAGVDHKIAGLASGLINTSRQVGGSIGLALLITAANDRTSDLIHQASANQAITEGYQRGLLLGAMFLALAAVTALFLAPLPKRPQPQRNDNVELAAELS